ncbi:MULTISPECIES: hypothetical protein [Massilia]|uniref:hypothetical protein n=1 Tax=Massilia TaxID=149698 RepID=UPI001C636A2A|nr:MULTISPECIES: hypothetical protein [Massilia]QYG00763.1 hypothetical protein KY496_20695 [Massilia sp. NP310]
MLASSTRARTVSGVAPESEVLALPVALTRLTPTVGAAGVTGVLPVPLPPLPLGVPGLPPPPPQADRVAARSSARLPYLMCWFFVLLSVGGRN